MKTTAQILKENEEWKRRRGLSWLEYINLSDVTQEELDLLYAEEIQEQDVLKGRVS